MGYTGQPFTMRTEVVGLGGAGVVRRLVVLILFVVRRLLVVRLLLVVRFAGGAFNTRDVVFRLTGGARTNFTESSSESSSNSSSRSPTDISKSLWRSRGRINGPLRDGWA